MKKLILSLLIVLFWGSAAFAAPAVTGVSGTVSNGNSITITGTGFGSKSTAAPWRWDTVDTWDRWGVQGTYSVTDGQTIPTGAAYPWMVNEGSRFKMETSESQRHAFSSKMYKGQMQYTGTDLGCKFNDTIISPSTGTIYLAWWNKYNGYDFRSWGGGSDKWLRLSDSSDPGDLTWSWSEYHSYTYINGCVGDYCPQSGGSYPETPGAQYTVGPDTWALHEVLINSTTETYYIWVNGSLVGNCTGDYTNTFTGCGAINYDEVWGIGLDLGGGTPPTDLMTEWMDDIYVDTTAQRVFLASQGGSCTGETPTYANCMTRAREIQIPSAWSTTEITATVNQGALADSSNAYLFVIDSANAASTGYLVTLGEGEETPPQSSAHGMTIGGGAHSVAVGGGNLTLTVAQ